MNYIFLDIDGVLNSSNYILSCFNNNKPVIYSCIDENSIKILSDICKATNAKIILSSAWRYEFNPNTLEPKYDTSKRLIQLFNKYNIELVGLTGFSYDNRGIQIKSYIEHHFNKNDKYVVIDDDSYDIIDYIDNSLYVHINTQTGLQKEHIKEIINRFK